MPFVVPYGSQGGQLLQWVMLFSFLDFFFPPKCITGFYDL